MNLKDIPYQRIPNVEEGVIDTAEKFRQMTDGIALDGKRVLDIGSHYGEMCRMAADAGAKQVLGIERNLETTLKAQSLSRHPVEQVEYRVGQAATVAGQFDVAILSGVLHHFTDKKSSLKQIARVLQPDGMALVGCKIGDGYPTLHEHRRLLEGYFDAVEVKCKVLSPDRSDRYLLICTSPKLLPPEAVLIIGKSEIGKSTLARDLAVPRMQCI